MLPMRVSEILDYGSNLHFTLWQCCSPHLVRFTNKNHSHRVKWSSRFGLSGSVSNWPNIAWKKVFFFFTLKGLKMVLTSSFKHQVFRHKLPWHLHKDFWLFFFLPLTQLQIVLTSLKKYLVLLQLTRLEILLQIPGFWLQMVLMSH